MLCASRTCRSRRRISRTSLTGLAGLGLALLAACSPAARPASPGQAQPFTLYLLNSLEANFSVAPLDLETLDDLQAAGRRVVAPEWVWGEFSADGSTQANVERPGGDASSPEPGEAWVVVRNWPAGDERSRFRLPADTRLHALSEDGARLALASFSPSEWPPRAEWRVVDTASGEQLAHVQGAERRCEHSWVDPAVRHVYCLAVSLAEAEGPRPLHIVAYDVQSGATAGEIELVEVLAGGWETDRVVGDRPVRAFLTPAVALSPDGRQLAAVHADAEAITLVSAPGLTVERTFALSRGTGLLDLLLPPAAHAKGPMEGVIRQAVFSLDGGYLYVFTQEVADEAPEQRGLGLVDLGTGRIVAEALPEFQIQWVRPAPDGSVYAFGTTDRRLAPYEIRPTSPSVLWRLDGRTLAPLAERAFKGYRTGRVVPGLTSGAGD